METTTHHAIGPDVTQTAYGKWLAVSAPGSHPRIGVIGDTEEEARDRFSTELERWRSLHDENDG